MNIDYHEKDGEIWFSYIERDQPESYNSCFFDGSGKVPDEVVAQGVAVIRSYVEDRVRTEIAEKKEKLRQKNAYAEDPDFPIETVHAGVQLSGRIVSALRSVLTVRLESPYEGEQNLKFGFASAMSGKHIFTEENEFSDAAIRSAKGMLICIYKEQQYREEHRSSVDIVDVLNEGREPLPLFYLDEEDV